MIILSLVCTGQIKTHGIQLKHMLNNKLRNIIKIVAAVSITLMFFAQCKQPGILQNGEAHKLV